jgi:hypothetical protein
VASEERVCGNLGDPAVSRRSHCENQPDRSQQPKEARPANGAGVRSAWSSLEQSRQIGTDTDEGADTNAKLAKETKTARLADHFGQPPCGRRWRVFVKSPVRENRSPGSVRGARSNPRPYHDISAERDAQRAKGRGVRAHRRRFATGKRHARAVRWSA